MTLHPDLEFIPALDVYPAAWLESPGFDWQENCLLVYRYNHTAEELTYSPYFFGLYR